MVGGPRNYYSFELFLEIREENEVFKPYNRGGVVVGVVMGVPTTPISAHLSPVPSRSQSKGTRGGLSLSGGEASGTDEGRARLDHPGTEGDHCRGECHMTVT